MDPNKIQSTLPQAPRGAFIHIPADGKLAAELNGITPLELYGALTLIVEKLRKDFEMK